MRKYNLDLVINGKSAEQFDDGLDVRLNVTLNDPSKLSYTQSEYSFTFDLPVTKKNNEIFDFAHVSAKRNKFIQRYSAVLYIDGVEIFNGNLKLASVTKHSYSCNLYLNRKNTIENVFGDDKLDSFKWYVPFNGVETINEVNGDSKTKYFYPLISYGLFQKIPNETSGVGYKKYTDKYQIDVTNRFYYNSFPPSLNLVELLKRLAESRNHTLAGDIITDKLLNEIYLSNYISDEQDPLYNLGNPNIGEVSLDIEFVNYSTRNGVTNVVSSYNQSYGLKYPKGENGNYDRVTVFNLLDEKINPNRGTTEHYLTISNVNNKSRMLTNGGIQIPANGFYEISATVEMWQPQQTIQNVKWWTDADHTEYSARTMSWNIENFPMEFQLLKYDGDDGNLDGISHDIIYCGEYPNESGNIGSVFNSGDTITTVSTTSTTRSGRGEFVSQNTTIKGDKISYTNVPQGESGYSPMAVTAVDQYNNPNFIMGLSSSHFATGPAYIKNGYSWSDEYITSVKSLYNCNGYWKKTNDTNYELTEVNANALQGASVAYDSYIQGDKRYCYGEPKMVVYLEKNDILIPFFQMREYTSATTENPTPYPREYILRAAGGCNATLKVRAVATEETETSKIAYNMVSNFDKELNLANFLNNQETIKDFFDNVAKTFNLSLSVSNGQIVMDKLKKTSTNIIGSVDIDDRTSMDNAVFNAIDFPKTIQVKFKDTDDEETTYRQQEKINNWDKTDFGSEKITVANVDDADEASITSPFAYTYPMKWKILDFAKYPTTTTFDEYELPTIAKSEWFIEGGYKYDEYQGKDGRGLPQRMWFRGEQTSSQLPVHGTYDDEHVEWYNITTTTQINEDNISLTFNERDSLLSYFYQLANCDATANEVELNIYLSPSEYQRIKQGAYIKFDDDIYAPLKLQGYDPTNNNTTTITLKQV